MRRHLRQGHVNQHDKTSEGQKQVFKIFNSRFFLIYSFNAFDKFESPPLRHGLVLCALKTAGNFLAFDRRYFVLLFVRPFFVCSFIRWFHHLFLFVRSSICPFVHSFVRCVVFPSMAPRKSPANGPGQRRLDPLLAWVRQACKPSGLPGTQPPSWLVSISGLKPKALLGG